MESVIRVVVLISRVVVTNYHNRGGFKQSILIFKSTGGQKS